MKRHKPKRIEETTNILIRESIRLVYSFMQQTRTSPRRSLLSKCHSVSQHTRKYNFIYAHKNEWSSLRRSLRNSLMLISFMRRSLISNYVQIINKCGKILQEVNLSPEVKYGLHYTVVHDNQYCSTALCEILLVQDFIRIRPKYSKFGKKSLTS